MQEFKGTPGPWHVSNEGCMLIRDDAGLSIVAKYVGYTNDEEELANAHLIAAAPELLDFIIEYKEAWDDGLAGDSYLLRKAEKVIAKALGK
jgi:hypothetical protein